MKVTERILKNRHDKRKKFDAIFSRLYLLLSRSHPNEAVHHSLTLTRIKGFEGLRWPENTNFNMLANINTLSPRHPFNRKIHLNLEKSHESFANYNINTFII